MEPEITAGGGVVYRENKKGKARYLVVHRPAYRDWTLAKGKPDRGETLAEAARREVKEETGITGKVRGELGAIRYHTDSGRKKLVHYWLMEAGKGRFRPNSEVDQVAWLPFRKAVRRLTFSRDRSVLDWAHSLRADGNRGRIYLVRHGNAGDRRSWKGTDEERPISGKGRTQARHLASLLTRVPVAAIISSPYVRCVQTVEPLADAIELKVELEARLAEGNGVESTRRLLGELAGRSAVICSHGDIIGDLIGYAAANGATMEADIAMKKGSTWVLETRKREIQSATYVRPMALRF